MSFNITPVASGYQELHPYSAMNIDSVKINTSLIMMKECTILTDVQTLSQYHSWGWGDYGSMMHKINSNVLLGGLSGLERDLNRTIADFDEIK